MKKLIISIVAALVFAAQLTFAAGEPENVKNLKATAVDSTSIQLAWDAAKDGAGAAVKNYRVYYGTTSVFKAGKGEYDSKIDSTDNKTTYTVAKLTAGTAYYFSVTALDSKGIESASYSYEASATTKAVAGSTVKDTTAPTVAKVSAADKTHVKVVFSEAVALPALIPETAFSIKQQVDSTKTLAVKSAKLDVLDTSKKTVVLETAEQTASVNYIVTAGVTVKDVAGNPMVSGSTDSGLFLGSAKAAAAATTSATTSSTTTTTTAATTSTGDCVKDMTCFLNYLKTCSVGKVLQEDTGKKYQYKVEVVGVDTVTSSNCSVKYTANVHPDILYATTYMTCQVPKGAYSSVAAYETVFDVKKCTGNLTKGYKSITAAKDTTPPENITNLLASYKKKLKKFIVSLSWTASLNTAKDLADQMLYQSLNRGKTYDTGKSLGALATKTDVTNLDGGKEYTFKVTTKDTSGNESTGVVKSIRLPQTGVGVGILLLGSMYGAHRVMRRKKD